MLRLILVEKLLVYLHDHHVDRRRGEYFIEWEWIRCGFIHKMQFMLGLAQNSEITLLFAQGFDVTVVIIWLI